MAKLKYKPEPRDLQRLLKHDLGLTFEISTKGYLFHRVNNKMTWSIMPMDTVDGQRLILERQPKDLQKYSGYAYPCSSYEELLKWLKRDELLMGEEIPLF